MADVYKRVIRVAIYCRISLAMHGDTVKVKRQEKICRKLAARLGWEVVYVFCDNNASAWKRNRKRPGWDAMLTAVEAGDIEGIITYHGDRLIRQPWDLEVLLGLAEGRGLKLASPTTTRNLDDADDRYRLRQDVAKACNESDSISRRTQDAHADRAAKGIVRKGGNRAFGYKRGGKIVDEEAAVYRDAVGRLIAGESKASIIRDWNKRGIVTTRGNPWKPDTFSTVMKNPRYAGLSTYKGEIVGKGRWKAIVDRDTWEALQVTLGAIADRYGVPDLNTTSKYLLTYIATHPGCGGVVRMVHNGRNKEVSYLCDDRTCTAKVRRNMRNTDEFVIGNVLRRLADPELWEMIDAGGADDGAGAELAALEARRQITLDSFADSSTVSPVQLDKMLRQFDEKIARVRGRIAARRTAHVLDGCRDMTREQWDAEPIDRRRSIVKATVTVQILRSRKGTGFDPASVVVTPVKVSGVAEESSATGADGQGD